MTTTTDPCNSTSIDCKNDHEKDSNNQDTLEDFYFFRQRQPFGNSRRQSANIITISWHLFLLATILFSSANVNAQRNIESTKPIGITTMAWVLGSVSSLLAILAIAFVIAYRGNKIVTIGQPFFLCLICFGALLMSFSLYFEAGSIEEIPGITLPVLDRLCVLQLWCFYCGMLVVLVAVICKLRRAELTCQFRKGRQILVRHVMWPFAGIITGETILLGSLTVVCPPSWQEVSVDFFGGAGRSNMTGFDVNSIDTETMDTADEFLPKCFGSHLPVMVPLQACSNALILTCMIVVVWMAYHTRNISEDIVDTKRVYHLMVCQLILFVPFLLLDYGVIRSGNAFHYLNLIFPFLFSVIAVGFLVFPKVYYVFYHKRHGTYPDSFRSTIMSNSNYNKVRISGVPSVP